MPAKIKNLKCSQVLTFAQKFDNDVAMLKTWTENTPDVHHKAHKMYHRLWAREQIGKLERTDPKLMTKLTALARPHRKKVMAKSQGVKPNAIENTDEIAAECWEYTKTLDPVTCDNDHSTAVVLTVRSKPIPFH